MTIGSSDRPAPAAPGPSARSRASAPPGAATAVLLVTVAADDGRAAALQPWEGASVIERLIGQLTRLGVAEVHVIARPAFTGDLEAALPAAVRVHASGDLAGDLRIVAGLARAGGGGLVLAAGGIVTHQEALAGLLADPRLGTAILADHAGPARRFVPRVRARRGRVMSAASAYHSVHRPTSAFLGVLKVTEGDRAALGAVADRLAELTTPAVPPAWAEAFEGRRRMWRLSLARSARRAAGQRLSPEERLDPASLPLPEADEAMLGLRLAAAEQDAASLLLTGLVREGVPVAIGALRELFWARPLSRDELAAAAREITTYDEDRVLLDSAVKASDGFFTTFFVSPYSRFVARWAARRGFTPNQVTTVSVLLGLLAAASFATGERWGMVAGALLLQISFTTDCVDGQLARYTRTFSKFGAWLDSIFDRTKEYAVFAGLAIGASQAGDDVWLLAAAALTLQTVRHLADISFAEVQRDRIDTTERPPLEQPRDRAGGEGDLEDEDVVAEESHAPEPEVAGGRSLRRRMLRYWRRIDRSPALLWPRKMIAFPIGERFAVISLTAALFTPRTAFVVLLSWGGVAAAYTLFGRILRSVV
jgi:hypothetical protein